MTEHRDTWRIFKIMGEFVEGFEKLSTVTKAISVFGSARVKPGDKTYETARKIGYYIAKAGFEVITGGGPGVMEAANRGAKDAGGRSIGLNILLPKEQGNDYCDLSIEFNYFFCRKVMFKKYSQGLIVCPGGFGTMDEMYEVLTLIQTRKTNWSPIVLVDSKFWNPVMDFFKSTLISNGYISDSDLDLIKVCDDPKEAVAMITDALEKVKSKTLVDF